MRLSAFAGCVATHICRTTRFVHLRCVATHPTNFIEFNLLAKNRAEFVRQSPSTGNSGLTKFNFVTYKPASLKSNSMQLSPQPGDVIAFRNHVSIGVRVPLRFLWRLVSCRKPL